VRENVSEGKKLTAAADVVDGSVVRDKRPGLLDRVRCRVGDFRVVLFEELRARGVKTKRF
jgi:hypothetical protein